MRRTVWMGLVAAICGCAPSESSDPYGEDVEVPATRVIAVADDGGQSEVWEVLNPTRLTGWYYTGAGPGFNMRLDLHADGTFDSSCGGCMGTYGTATGTWVLGAEGVTLTATRADGLLQEKPLDRLCVATFQEHYLLVQESVLDLFERWGPTHGSCLHQKAAGETIEIQRAGGVRDGGVRSGVIQRRGQ